MNKQYLFTFNSDRCIKCWACEIACQQWKGIPAGTLKLRKVVEETAGTFPDIMRKFFSLTCRHCADAPCAAACPEEAITKRQEDGIVVVYRDKCNGCQVCLDACPYDIPQFDKNGKMQKCDMCLDRIKIGQEPMCAATCPTRALSWGLVEEPSRPVAKK
jgi:anaerobic dimethyl sulfoxide reductase subunit B (iron-sulfur subunit)